MDHLFRACPDKVITDMKQNDSRYLGSFPFFRKSSANIHVHKGTFTTPAVTSTSDINVLSTHTNSYKKTTPTTYKDVSFLYYVLLY